MIRENSMSAYNSKLAGFRSTNWFAKLSSWFSLHRNAQPVRRKDIESQELNVLSHPLNVPVSIDTLDETPRELLDAIRGTQTEPELRQPDSLYIALLKTYVESLPVAVLNGILTPQIIQDESPVLPVFGIMKAVSELLVSGSRTSITDILDGLISRHLISEACSDCGNDRATGINFVIILVGWMSMLYPASLNIRLDGGIYPDEQYFVNVQNPETSLQAERPIVEFLRGFEDEILPDPHPAMVDNSFSKDLHVSNLNVQTLIDIGDIKIYWTTNIGHHLKFNVSTQRLSIFCFPSFCKMHSTTEDCWLLQEMLFYR
jgi:hypothetical protein